MWRFTPVVCAVLLAAGPAVAQAPAGKSYELRTYRAADGRLDELHARFRQHSLPLLQRHGAEVVGTWVPKPNPDNVVVALLAYPSPAARQAVWASVVADPQWAALKRADRRGLLVEDIAELPLTAVKALEARASLGELELRTHDRPETPAGAIGAWVPARPRPGVALVSLHPRQPDATPRPSRSLVSLLLVADPPPADAPRVTVLAPTDYSPLK